jgi:hypothetical protein
MQNFLDVFVSLISEEFLGCFWVSEKVRNFWGFEMWEKFYEVYKNDKFLGWRWIFI